MTMDTCCLICRSLSIVPILRREQVPVHQNLVFDDQEAAVAVKRGDLDLVLCETCGFIFNRAFDASLLEYGNHYKNPQEDSPTYTRYMSHLLSHLMERMSVRENRILEIGCGNGSFLRRLVEEGWDNIGLGFDPSYVGPLTDLEGRLRFVPHRYGAGDLHSHDDWVICRHVVEHVPDPLHLLRVIRWTLDAGYKARVFLETPTVAWILRNRIPWDFFYEHRSYFTHASLRTACQIVGITIETAQTEFGGQCLWLEGKVSDKRQVVALDPGDVPVLARAFGMGEARLLEDLRAKARELATHGGVAIWGAAAKGVTLANLLDPRRTLVSCIVDMNAQKQGRFLPGTGHPIVAPERLGELGVTAAILTNPMYRDEIVALLASQGNRIQLIDPMEVDE